MTKSSSVVNFLLVALLTFALGFYMGGAGCGQSKDDAKAPDAAVKAPDVKKVDVKPAAKVKKAGEERFNVPLGNSYWKGDENALITIVEISEFQCPFCNRVGPTIKKIMEDYAGKVKVVFKHNPLPFHKDAPLASQAALEAGAQGKFWEMHDKLFANQKALKRENLDKFAQEIGLDMGKFKAALDSNKYDKDIKADQKVAQNFAARGTPHFFVNGIRVKGAQPFEKFKAVIDAELVKAEAVKKSGAKNIYAEIVKNAKTKAEAPAPRQRQEDKATYKVTSGKKGSCKGNCDGALVTIVEFSEFQCPFCSRVNPTIAQIKKEYGDKVRVFFRNNPLPFHKDAMGAAKAALAAREQGKFWEMHDKMFQNQKALQADKLSGYAKELGLDVAKFEKDMKDPKFDAEIKADMAEAQKFGARGTPGFFVNGRKIVGAQPFANFKKLIDEILPVAQKAGKKGDALYAELTKGGLDKAEAPKRKERPKEDPNKVYNVPAGTSYFKGGKDAKVTIIEFSEFQCPFCSRVNPTMDKIKEKYGNKVKIVFKHNPLPFHKDAPMASQAALAAGEQGKFWEMHDKMFANQKALKRADLDKYAGEIGLNVDKFKKALDAEAYKAQIAEDQKLAASVGARGTPTFFINGKKLTGAQPYENFEKMIEEALKK